MVTGVVQAVSVEAAKKILVKHELTPLAITLPHTFLDYLPFYNQVSVKDKSLFARQLATMIEAGLTLSQSMRLLIRQARHPRFRSILEAIFNDLQDGFSFSTALAKFPDVFDAIFISVVRSGEATGKLEIVLAQLATNLEKEVKIRSRIKGALMYPAFILCVMVGVMILMVVRVIPQLRDVFISAGKQLPLSTQFLIGFSDFMITKWYVILIGLFLLGVGIRTYLRSEGGARAYSRFAVKLPIFGTIVEQSAMARFGRLLEILLGSGVPLLEALRLVTESFTNRLYRRSVYEVAVQVERGLPMSAPINEDPAFPYMVGQMVAVGEQTGKMDEVMGRMANYYEMEVESKVTGLSSLIEPIVIILLGIGVAFLVSAILLPIYQISTSI